MISNTNKRKILLLGLLALSSSIAYAGNMADIVDYNVYAQKEDGSIDWDNVIGTRDSDFVMLGQQTIHQRKNASNPANPVILNLDESYWVTLEVKNDSEIIAENAGMIINPRNYESTPRINSYVGAGLIKIIQTYQEYELNPGETKVLGPAKFSTMSPYSAESLLRPVEEAPYYLNLHTYASGSGRDYGLVRLDVNRTGTNWINITIHSGTISYEYSDEYSNVAYVPAGEDINVLLAVTNENEFEDFNGCFRLTVTGNGSQDQILNLAPNETKTLKTSITLIDSRMVINAYLSSLEGEDPPVCTQGYYNIEPFIRNWVPPGNTIKSRFYKGEFQKDWYFKGESPSLEGIRIMKEGWPELGEGAYIILNLNKILGEGTQQTIDSKTYYLPEKAYEPTTYSYIFIDALPDGNHENCGGTLWSCFDADLTFRPLTEHLSNFQLQAYLFDGDGNQIPRVEYHPPQYNGFRLWSCDVYTGKDCKQNLPCTKTVNPNFSISVDRNGPVARYECMLPSTLIDGEHYLTRFKFPEGRDLNNNLVNYFPTPLTVGDFEGILIEENNLDFLTMPLNFGNAETYYFYLTPDLTVSDFSTTPDPVIPGNPATFNVKIKNIGFMDASSTWDNNFYVLVDYGDDSNELLGPYDLVEGEEKEIILNHTYGPNSYTMTITVDPATSPDRVIEGNENNNTFETEFICDGGICIECMLDEHCHNPDNPVCCNNACQACCTGKEEACIEQGLVCDVSNGECVECFDDAHCTRPLLCNTSTNTCEQPITCGADECKLGEVCCDVGGIASCVPLSAVGVTCGNNCVDDANCPLGNICVNTKCISQCNDSMCAGNYTCLVDNTCGTCTDDSDCSGGRICDTGKCIGGTCSIQGCQPEDYLYCPEQCLEEYKEVSGNYEITIHAPIKVFEERIGEPHDIQTEIRKLAGTFAGDTATIKIGDTEIKFVTLPPDTNYSIVSESWVPSTTPADNKVYTVKVIVTPSEPLAKGIATRYIPLAEPFKRAVPELHPILVLLVLGIACVMVFWPGREQGES